MLPTVGESVAKVDRCRCGRPQHRRWLRTRPNLLAAKIEAIRKVAAREGVDIFVNARIDVYLFKLVPPAEAVAESLRRAKIYQDAGASGIFVPAIVAPDEIKTVVAGIDRPLNVLAWPGLAPAAELAKLGVKRLSAGSGISRPSGAGRRPWPSPSCRRAPMRRWPKTPWMSGTANGLYNEMSIRIRRGPALRQGAPDKKRAPPRSRAPEGDGSAASGVTDATLDLVFGRCRVFLT